MSTVFEVRQDSLTCLGDGNKPPAALLRMGVLPAATKWDLFALQGRMFNLHQGTVGTAVNGSEVAVGAIVLTAPTVRFTVPVGTTVFPRRLSVAYATAAGTANELALCYTDSDTYDSGGVALVPKNWRTDNPRATAVTKCYIGSSGGTPLVEAALTNVRALYQAVIPLAFTFATSYTLEKQYEVKFDNLIPIVGPASVLLFASAATTAQTIYFSLDWAEVDTECAVTAV